MRPERCGQVGAPTSSHNASAVSARSTLSSRTSCPGSNGCVWADGDAFAVGAADTTDQYSVAWPVGQANGAYQIIARATDNVGNTTDTAAPVNVTLDNTNPRSDARAEHDLAERRPRPGVQVGQHRLLRRRDGRYGCDED